MNSFLKNAVNEVPEIEPQVSIFLPFRANFDCFVGLNFDRVQRQKMSASRRHIVNNELQFQTADNTKKFRVKAMNTCMHFLQVTWLPHWNVSTPCFLYSTLRQLRNLLLMLRVHNFEEELIIIVIVNT